MTKKKTKKTPKAPKPKLLSHDEAFNTGWDAEQTLADTIVAKIHESDEEALDTAFIAAFQALSNRMLHIWERGMLLEIVNECADMVEEEHGHTHVCEDCQEEQIEEQANKEARSKLH